ncbi:uncharacterized protein [Ambystoma mexicanum]|uniref:uncharacterized protein n=1 Tax=Ambystoma mexicanum TaxID=8296 RepID=UPI0037E8FCB8
MQGEHAFEEQWVCVFVAADSSLWTKKLSELREAGNGDVCAGSRVTFKLPGHFLTRQGEQEYKGTVLFIAPGINSCEERKRALQGFVAEKAGMPGHEVLDLLLDVVKEFSPLMPSTQVSSTGEDNLGQPCKKIKTYDVHFQYGGVRYSPEPMASAHLHKTMSRPPVPVKSEQAGVSRLHSSIDEDTLQFPLGDFESVEDTEDEENDEDKSDKNNPFAVLEKLIKENQKLKKENARLKQMLSAAHNAAPFRLLTRETRDSAAYYLRLVLENLEKTNAPPPSPSTSEITERHTVLSPANMQVPLILHSKDPERFSHILVDSFKVRDSISKARAAKDHGIALLNQAIDMVFSPLELAQSSGLGMRGNRKDDALDPVRVQACREFVRSICKENNWEEPTEAGLRKRFSNKISNARRELKLKTQLLPDEHMND